MHSEMVKSTMVRDARMAVSWFDMLRDASRNDDDVGTDAGGTALVGCC